MAIYSLTVFFRIMHDGLSERGAGVPALQLVLSNG